MLEKITENRVYNIVLIISTIISSICVCLSHYKIIDENLLIIKKVCGFIVLEYFFIKIYNFIFGLYKKDPDYNFVINQICNINLLFAVITLMETFYSNNENIYMSLYYASIIVVLVSTIFNIYNLYINSKNGVIILSCLILTFFLGLFNEKNQAFITIITTLIATVFGETVLKNLFKTQIAEYEKNKKIKQDAIIDILEYKLAMANIIIIYTQIIIWITNSLNYIDLIDGLKWLEKYIILGIIRFIILALTYILFLSEYGENLIKHLFDFLMRSK